MKKSITAVVSVLGVAGIYWLGQAGDLEPPGPPDPTMVTLQELFDRLASLQPPVDTCFDDTGDRFVDCGNGTVKDTETGLFWLKDADCDFSPGPINTVNWGPASIAAAQLADGQCGLTDGSRPGDWRLPTLECPSGVGCPIADATGEFASIFAPSCPPPFLPNTAGTGCWSEGNPFSGVQLFYYWSSTTSASLPQFAYDVGLGAGTVGPNLKTFGRWVWPVRGGQ